MRSRGQQLHWLRCCRIGFAMPYGPYDMAHVCELSALCRARLSTIASATATLCDVRRYCTACLPDTTTMRLQMAVVEVCDNGALRLDTMCVCLESQFTYKYGMRWPACVISLAFVCCAICWPLQSSACTCRSADGFTQSRQVRAVEGCGRPAKLLEALQELHPGIWWPLRQTSPVALQAQCIR